MSKVLICSKYSLFFLGDDEKRLVLRFYLSREVLVGSPAEEKAQSVTSDEKIVVLSSRPHQP